MITSLVAVIIGFCIDCVLGERLIFMHPIILIGKLISLLEKLLRSLFPKTKTGEFIGGIVLVLLVVSFSSTIPFLLLYFSLKVSILLKFIIESIMCWQIIAAKSLKTESMKVYTALKNNDLEKARYAVSMIVGRDTANLNSSEITRAAVETVAENTSDGVIAPLLFMIFGGASFGFFYKAINTLDSMVGYKNSTYIYFGRCAAILDDIVNFIPARISAFLMIFASIFLKYDTKNAYKIWKRDRRKHQSPNSAQTESVCAGALQIQLAGNTSYGGMLHKKDFIGDPIRPIEYEDIQGANTLMYASTYVCLVIFSLFKIAAIFAIRGMLC